MKRYIETFRRSEEARRMTTRTELLTLDAAPVQLEVSDCLETMS